MEGVYSKKKEFASLGFSEGTWDAEKQTGSDKSDLVKVAENNNNNNNNNNNTKKNNNKKTTKYIQSS